MEVTVVILPIAPAVGFGSPQVGPISRHVLSRGRRKLDSTHAGARGSTPEVGEDRQQQPGIADLNTLTTHRLDAPAKVRQVLASTNVVESAFSMVEGVCRTAKHWRAGGQVERLAGIGLTVAEAPFSRVEGCQHLSLLLSSLASAETRRLRTARDRSTLNVARVAAFNETSELEDQIS